MQGKRGRMDAVQRDGSWSVKAARTAAPTSQGRCACRLIRPHTEALTGRPGEPPASSGPRVQQRHSCNLRRSVLSICSVPGTAVTARDTGGNKTQGEGACQ